MLDKDISLKNAPTILFVVNAPEFFLSHRLPLAVAAKKAGYKVHVATADGPEVVTIKELGFEHHVVPFARSGQNPLVELNTIYLLIRLFFQVKPDLVHLITIKPVVYGGLAARFSGISSVVSAVSGLGTVFLASTLSGKVRRWIVTKLYSAAFKQKKLAVIFQNPNDRDTLIEMTNLKKIQTRMIRGSGVSLDEYPYLPEPEGRPVVVMAARLLRDKGVLEFVGAAGLLRERGVSVCMRLIGSPDPGNPTTIQQKVVNGWQKESNLELLGFRSDIAHQYANANIICLPSYREGLPKSLIEAAACGRSVVTTDVPGCRDAITPGKTGVLVPVRDAVALADAIQMLIEDSVIRQKMGAAGRKLAEEAFNIEGIVNQHMEIYREQLCNG